VGRKDVKPKHLRLISQGMSKKWKGEGLGRGGGRVEGRSDQICQKEIAASTKKEKRDTSSGKVTGA